MKIFAIRDENDKSNKNLALLFYYEREKQFCIELPENADPWETPLLLSAFVKKGIKTVSAYRRTSYGFFQKRRSEKL